MDYSTRNPTATCTMWARGYKRPLFYRAKAWINTVRLLVPAYNIAAIIFYFFTDNYLPVLAGVFIGWLFIGRFAKQINQQHLLLGKNNRYWNSMLPSFACSAPPIKAPPRYCSSNKLPLEKPTSPLKSYPNSLASSTSASICW